MKQPLVIVFLIVLVAAVFSSCGPRARTDVPKYTIEQFYANERIGGGAFSPDETKLLVSSNRTGIFNVFEISIADSAKRQVTASTVESYFSVDYVPGTGEILYTADKGGNENNHLYLLTAEGSSRDLTPGKNEKVSFLRWSVDKKSFFYLSNKRTPRFFDVYLMAVGTWVPVMVYRNDKGMNVDDVSRDGNKVALNESITSSENRLYVHDLATGKTVEISDPAIPGTYNTAGFSNDRTTFFYTTDAGKEFQYLAKFDLTTSSRSTVFQTTWDVMYSYTSENEKYRVIGINEDAKNVLKVIDNATGADVAMPAIPDGDVLAVEISPSEKLMRLTIGTSRSPSDVYVYEFGTKKLSRLTNALNPEIDPNNLVAAEVVRYKSFDGLDIPAVFYKPLTASSSNRVPALVWVHGGPGGQSRVGFNELIQYLTNHGYAVLAVNNRGSSGYGKTFYKMDDRNHGERDLTDCVYGKKYLQGLDDIEGEKIGIFGGSYGGFMTMAAMAFQPDEFKVGVNLFGVTNWIRTLKSIPPHWEAGRKALYAELGDPFSADSVRLYNISPVFHGGKVKNPVMVLQGANDIRVLQVESDEMVAAIRANNVPVEYVIFPDEGHGFRKKENQIKGYGQVLTFLDRYLMGKKEKSE
jgi:dipeptidyl aminopeptidase/acylaminoacyl peptidase